MSCDAGSPPLVCPTYFRQVEMVRRFTFEQVGKDPSHKMFYSSSKSIVDGFACCLQLEFIGYYKCTLHIDDDIEETDRIVPAKDLLITRAVTTRTDGIEHVHVVDLSSFDRLIEQPDLLTEDGSLVIEATWLNTQPAHVPYDVPSVSNVALVIDGRPLYVSRELLALHSSYFYRLFYGSKPAISSKIEINDVEFDDFRELLGVLPPEYKEVTADNVSVLQRLANGFDMPMVKRQCLEFRQRERGQPLFEDDQKLVESLFLTDGEALCRYAILTAQSDRCVIVEGVEVPVCPEILALHSSYFYSIFFDDRFADRTRRAHGLPDDVSLDDFRLLIDVLCCSPIDGVARINARNVEHLLALADMLDIPYVSYVVSKFLSDDYEGNRSIDSRYNYLLHRYLVLADKYSLHGLRHALIKSVVHEYDYDIVSSSFCRGLSVRTEQLLHDGQLTHRRCSCNTFVVYEPVCW